MKPFDTLLFEAPVGLPYDDHITLKKILEAIELSDEQSELIAEHLYFCGRYDQLKLPCDIALARRWCSIHNNKERESLTMFSDQRFTPNRHVVVTLYPLSFSFGLRSENTVRVGIRHGRS